MNTFFDVHSFDYDNSFTHTPIGIFQRKRVYHYVEKIIPDNTAIDILEINCGTGEDALWLAKKNHVVIATDASEKMIAVCQSKKNKHSKLNLEFAHCPFNKLGTKFSEKKFDLIFSNFGGLNCVVGEELKNLCRNFSALLKPGGKLIAVVMGRKCLWEQLYFLLKGKPKEAFRRKSKSPAKVQLNGAVQQIWYYSPTEFSKFTEKNFTLEFQKPVGLFVPPSYLSPFFVNKTFLLKVLNVFEKHLSFSFLSNRADHFIVTLTRK